MAWWVKNWKQFQHFKDRRPPWIKLYKQLLDDDEWFDLDPSTAKVLVMLWLLASEGENGELPTMKKMCFRLRMKEGQLNQHLTRLSHWLYQDDITPISERYQDDGSETETETETYKKETEEKACQLLEFLNTKSGKNFRAYIGVNGHEKPTKSLELVLARLQEFSMDDLRGMVAMKCRRWKDDPKMCEFLRPSTLFGKEKCEMYVGEQEGGDHGMS